MARRYNRRRRGTPGRSRRYALRLVPSRANAGKARNKGGIRL